jgi:hypothetical protein
MSWLGISEENNVKSSRLWACTPLNHTCMNRDVTINIRILPPHLFFFPKKKSHWCIYGPLKIIGGIVRQVSTIIYLVLALRRAFELLKAPSLKHMSVAAPGSARPLYQFTCNVWPRLVPWICYVLFNWAANIKQQACCFLLGKSDTSWKLLFISEFAVFPDAFFVIRGGFLFVCFR